jgi:ketosteroid isomerase-like protein
VASEGLDPRNPVQKESTVLSHEETIAEVKRANERFYRAFESLDIDRMAAMWVQATRAKCVHPGWDLLEGWEAICQSWEGIFANTDYMRFVITDVSVHVYGRVAWVTCVENLSDAPDTSQLSRILATNVYENVDGDWHIVHHHASPILRPMRRLEGREELN